VSRAGVGVAGEGVPPRPPRKVGAKSAGAVAVGSPAQPLTAPPAASSRRAEEEDEHLERTLEQNKGKMAKKEEKCVLQ